LSSLSVDTAEETQTLAVRPRLDHVDAIRPVKQFGVVTTHSVNFFAPAASLAAGATLMLLHVSREAFLFVSACMLAYANPDLARIQWKTFARRRAASILVPYACWTVIYWAVTATFPLTSATQEVHRLLHLFLTGYYQLYYLLVIAQFYVLFPVFMLVIHATRRHPLRLLAASAALQLTITSLMHWSVLPTHMQGYWATREISSYQLYLVGGCLAAVHLHDFERWLIDHARVVVASTLATAIVAEAWYVLAARHVLTWMGGPSDPFQPIVVPFNVGAILSLYLLGRVMVSSERSARFRAWVRRGSDRSYGIFLGHMVFVSILVDVHWGRLRSTVPWPIIVAGGAVLAYGSAWMLSALLSRTPASMALTGQRRRRSPPAGAGAPTLTSAA
jgi:peptidoglycan/LPS O-acetylase OafA/YrhL